MTAPTKELAAFAATLAYDDIPPDVREGAKHCIIDAIGAAIFGGTLPWAEIITGYAYARGAGGSSTLLGSRLRKVQASLAALANGTLTHASEFDSVRLPPAGVHPGAILMPAGLAIAEEIRATGRELLAAFVAGCEVLFRIGAASRRTSETLGFHAPGVTGPFGSAVVAGRLLQLSPERMVSALGIAGSLCSGLLEFASSGNGAMVKRLHLGRAAEGGLLAAHLAGDGFSAPHTILEGRHGFLTVYCREADTASLTCGLGRVWETRNIWLKRYPCHIAAHVLLDALRELRLLHHFSPNEVASINVATSDARLAHHRIYEPADVLIAQYSVPFCLALSLFRDPTDPSSFSPETLVDPSIRSLTRRVLFETLVPPSENPGTSTIRVVVCLADGRELVRQVDDSAAVRTRLTDHEVEGKFLRLAEALGPCGPRLFARLRRLDEQEDVSGLLVGNDEPA